MMMLAASNSLPNVLNEMIVDDSLDFIDIIDGNWIKNYNIKNG
jgi:hypothetical protein